MRLAITNLVFATVAIGCTISPSGNVTIENQEDQPLFSVVFNSPGSDTSTTSVLGTGQLFPGDRLALPLECGTYDVSVAVAGGDQPPGVGMCRIADEDVCASGTTFVISADNCDLGE